MVKKKQFTKRANQNLLIFRKPETPINISEFLHCPPKQKKVLFSNTRASAYSSRRFDFTSFYGKNADEIVVACQKQIELFLENRTSIRTVSTLTNYCRTGLSYFLNYCILLASSRNAELKISDINRELINGFLSHLTQINLKTTSQKNTYSSTKAVLMALGKNGVINLKNLFPKNPYPNNRHKNSPFHSLTKLERTALASALRQELNKIFGSDKNSLISYDLSICLLAIALRTGRNTTPLLELSINCLMDHPLKENHKLLVSYKRRGNGVQLMSLRNSQVIETMTTIMPEVVTIIQRVKELTQPLRDRCISQYQDRLFIYTISNRVFSKKIKVLSQGCLQRAIESLVEKYLIMDGDGKPLKITVSRLRKTFENQLWQLSNNDPYVTARLAGHSIKVSNDHYLEVTEEMQENWQMMGEIRVAELTTTSINKTENTPVGQCKDPLNGHKAPKNGQICGDFLSCFRCRSYVITQDDLYRLYSFYWLLVKERNFIGSVKWNRYYSHIIRIIDSQIQPRFSSKIVEFERDRALSNPHPFWRNREQILEMK